MNPLRKPYSTCTQTPRRMLSSQMNLRCWQLKGWWCSLRGWVCSCSGQDNYGISEGNPSTPNLSLLPCALRSTFSRTNEIGGNRAIRRGTHRWRSPWCHVFHGELSRAEPWRLAPATCGKERWGTPKNSFWTVQCSKMMGNCPGTPFTVWASGQLT